METSNSGLSYANYYILLFRIEQPYMTLNQSLFQAISCCTMLQRLCIIAKRSDFQAKDVQQLMENVCNY